MKVEEMKPHELHRVIACFGIQQENIEIPKFRQLKNFRTLGNASLGFKYGLCVVNGAYRIFNNSGPPTIVAPQQ